MESGFRIDGERYSVPTLDTFDMDEAQILFDYSGLAIEDFVPPNPEADEEEQSTYRQELRSKVKNPMFLRALMHVAYRRKNMTMTRSQIEQVIAAGNHMQAVVDFLQTSEADEDPTQGSTSDSDTPKTSSDSSSRSSSKSSGQRSAKRSIAPA